MDKLKEYLLRLWRLFTDEDYFIEPFLFVIFLSLFVSRIEIILDALHKSVYGFKEVFYTDISQNRLFYALFLIVFITYLYVKMKNSKREKEFKNMLIKSLKSENKLLKKIDKKLRY